MQRKEREKKSNSRICPREPHNSESDAAGLGMFTIITIIIIIHGYVRKGLCHRGVNESDIADSLIV